MDYALISMEFVFSYSTLNATEFKNHIFCLFKRSSMSELLRFLMEVELTHLFNGFKWF
jgi:hypothetical protein